MSVLERVREVESTRGTAEQAPVSLRLMRERLKGALVERMGLSDDGRKLLDSIVRPFRFISAGAHTTGGHNLDEISAVSYLLPYSFDAAPHAVKAPIANVILRQPSDIFVGVNNTISATGNMTDVGEAIATLINNQGWLEQIVCVIVVLFLYIALAGTFIGIITQVLMNLVKLVMGFCVSPIPIAIGQFDGGGSNTCKNFFMWIASLGLTYTLILICVKIYTLGISSLSIANNFPVIGDFIGAMLGLICCNSLLLASVSYAPTLAEKLTGGR